SSPAGSRWAERASATATPGRAFIPASRVRPSRPPIRSSSIGTGRFAGPTTSSSAAGCTVGPRSRSPPASGSSTSPTRASGRAITSASTRISRSRPAPANAMWQSPLAAPVSRLPDKLDLALVIRLREAVVGGKATTESELRALADQAGGWARATEAQLRAADARLGKLNADPASPLAEMAEEIRRVDALGEELG